MRQTAVVHALVSIALLACDCSEQPAAHSDGGHVDGGSDANAADASGVLDSAIDSSPPVPPDPPPWDPPFPLEGGTGWRDSTDPLCSPYAGRIWGTGVDVWSDERGVFAIVSNYNDAFRLDTLYEDGVSVHFNDGTGWMLVYQEAAEPGSGGAWRMTGVDGGPVVIWPGACPLRRLEIGGATTCIFAEEPNVVDLSMISATSGWLATGSGLAWLDGSTVASIGAFDPSGDPVAVMGDAESTKAITMTTLYSGQRPSELMELRTADSGAEFTALWADSETDYWVGTFSGQLLHYNGADFDLIETGSSDLIIGIWYDGVTVYWATPRAFGRVTGDTSELLLSTSSTDTAIIASMHGQQTTGEVYLGFVDLEFERYACGAGILVWFDGTRFGRF